MLYSASFGKGRYIRYGYTIDSNQIKCSFVVCLVSNIFAVFLSL